MKKQNVSKTNKSLNKTNHSVVLLGKIIRQERGKRKLTQTALGDLSGTSINFISQIEAGKESAHMGKVLKVLQILGIQLEIVHGSKGLIDRIGE